MNPQHRKESNNWFKRYENRLGSLKILIPIGLIISFIVIGIVTSLSYLSFFISHSITVGFGIFFGIFFFIVWIKLKNDFYDNLGIRKELLIFIRVVILYAILGTLLISLHQFMGNNEKQQQQNFDILWNYMISSTYMVLTYIYTVYPRKLSLEAKRRRSIASIHGTAAATTMTNHACKRCTSCCYCCMKYERLNICICCFWCCIDDDKLRNGNGGNAPGLAFGVESNDHSSSSRSISAAQQSDSRLETIGEHWSDIVCTPYGYEAFMNHLETEFSIENLLFITEVCYNQLLHFCFLLHLFFVIFLLFGVLTVFCMFSLFSLFLLFCNFHFMLRVFYG